MWPTLAVASLALYHARNAPFHPGIHNLGNVGCRGRVHASGARFATSMIDRFAYGGRNVRREVAGWMAACYPPNATAVVDWGCGVGTFTHELARRAAFAQVQGIDTSEEMLAQARADVPNVRFDRANVVDAHRLGAAPGTCVSLVGFVAHEMPRSAHRRLVRSLCRASAGDLWVVDIDPHYEPTAAFLSGEPFVEAYFAQFDQTLREEARRAGRYLHEYAVLPGHVKAWIVSGRAGDALDAAAPCARTTAVRPVRALARAPVSACPSGEDQRVRD